MLILWTKLLPYDGGVYQNAYTSTHTEPGRTHNAFHHYVGGGIKKGEKRSHNEITVV